MGNDDAKRLILARRARFVAAALAGVTAASVGVASVEACGGGTEEVPSPERDGGNPQPCLTSQQIPPTQNDGGGDPDAAPRPCLEPYYDAGPQPCLTPRPCLSTTPPDAGGEEK